MWFAVGAIGGGATSGILLGTLGLLVPQASWWAIPAVALVLILVVLHDTGLVSIRFPQNERQVRQTVVRMQPASGALMFGFELGTGARTYMTGAAPYVAITAALLAGSPDFLPGLLVGVGFGLGRGLVPMSRRMHRSEDTWDAWIRRRGARTLPVSSAIATALVATVGLLVY
jgi:hypothetical protein